jgi:hypothetical protein
MIVMEEDLVEKAEGEKKERERDRMEEGVI